MLILWLLYFNKLPYFYALIDFFIPANQVNVRWAGYYNTTSNIWTPVWGDGIKVDEEKCDDNNILNGDGCSNFCKIEQGFQWITDNSGKSNCQNTARIYWR